MLTNQITEPQSCGVGLLLIVEENPGGGRDEERQNVDIDVTPLRTSDLMKKMKKMTIQLQKV